MKNINLITSIFELRVFNIFYIFRLLQKYIFKQPFIQFSKT